MTTVPSVKGFIRDKLYYQCTMNAKDLSLKRLTEDKVPIIIGDFSNES